MGKADFESQIGSGFASCGCGSDPPTSCSNECDGILCNVQQNPAMTLDCLNCVDDKFSMMSSTFCVSCNPGDVSACGEFVACLIACVP